MKYLRKYNDIPKSVKASLWYMICNILQKGISFIVIPIYTRILTAEEYGRFSVFQSWRDIIIIFATLNLYCGVFTKAMVDYDDDRDRYTSSMQGLSTSITLVLFVIYFWGQNFWNRILDMGTVTMVLLFVYYITYPAFSFWSVRQRVEYKYIKMVVVTLMTSVAIPITSILLLKFTDLREEAVIWGYLIVQILVSSYIYLYNFVKGKCFFQKEYWKHALIFNIPLIPHYLSLIVLGQADRIMISNICGSDKAAIYSLAYQVSMIMNIVISAINGSLVPWIYDKLKKKEYKSINVITKYVGMLIAIMSVCAILIAPEIVGILGTKEYLSAVWIIPAVATSVYFTYCYGLFSNVEFYYGVTKYVMVASTVGAITNLGLNAIFIPSFGFIAAGYTTLFCYFLFMLMHYYYMKKVCKAYMEIFNIKFVVSSCLMVCICAGICMLMYNGWLLRYFIIVIVGVIALVYRKKILALLKLLKT